MLQPDGADAVLWVHILAACVWIGGQVVLGLLVPLLRSDRQTLIAAARRYQQVAWLAFAVLLITGIFNARNSGITWSNLHTSDTGRTLELKLALVAISGITSALHAFVLGPRATATNSSRWRSFSGGAAALSLLAAVGAALYGVVIAQH